MLRRSLLYVIGFGLGLASASGQTLRYPTLGGQIRVEGHLLPAVSTGPLDPSWSPDGEWLAFSMRGDIWKLPAEGGEAVALTEAPGYHFEPVWSPDGSRLALTVDLDGNLDIALVRAEGGSVERLTQDPHVDIQPAWSPDGQSLYFVSGRGGSLDIYRLDLASGEKIPVVSGQRHDIQPSVSPDGRRLAYIAPVQGRMGSGGIWVKRLPDGEPELLHYEETSFRAKPTWTPDGSALVYVSDAAGSNDIAVVPASGGNYVRLTEHPMDEYAPVVSPDGSRIAFVSNRTGPTRLHTMAAGGGAGGAWSPVPIESRRPRVAHGRLRGEVRGPDGAVTPARILLLASDGRAYAPDEGFHRVSSVNEIHYFHTRDAFEVDLPAGEVSVEALRGFEYQPRPVRVDVPAGGTADVVLTLERLVDAPARGWFSGDNHVHDLHQGRFGLTQEEFFYQLVADDLHVTNDLIHMDGTKLMGRWSDLTGEPYRLSNDDYILFYTQEFRGSFGHVGLLGVQRFIMPLIGGTRGTPYAADVLKVRYLDEVRAQGGIGGFLHPYNGSVDTPEQAASSDIPLHVALGKGDFFDVVCIASDELSSVKMYYRFLNSGFRIPATGGTDNFSNVWRDPSGGTARTYAHLDGKLGYRAWLSAVKAGRTFATNGPLLFFEVEGKGPGEEIRLKPGDPSGLSVQAELVSIVPIDKLEILVNGEVVETSRPSGDGTRMEVSVSVDVPGSGWVAARAIGSKHRYVGDNYPFAQTSPVYVEREGAPFALAEDARFLLEVVNELWRRVEARDAWPSATEKETYLRAVEEARSAYQRAIDIAKGTQ